MGGIVGRVMGLDVGDKRIGIAISDPLGITAQGLPTYYRGRDSAADADAVAKIFGDNGCDVAVVGLPKLMSGVEGEQAVRTREFAALLAERGIRVALWDERLTTAAAHRILIEGDTRRAKRKTVVDKVAAVLILQGWLDATEQMRYNLLEKGANKHG